MRPWPDRRSRRLHGGHKRRQVEVVGPVHVHDGRGGEDEVAGELVDVKICSADAEVGLEGERPRGCGTRGRGKEAGQG